jgi:MFS transporter, AAHS family, 4-hydroxybenzoate transporter
LSSAGAATRGAELPELTTATVGMQAGHVDLDHLLDSQRFSARHAWVVALCFCVVVIDGYDLLVTAQLLPAIAQEYGVTSAVLTKAFAAQTFGQAIGAFALSPLADRLGRKPVLLVCLLLFGIATLGSVVCRNMLEFGVLRLFAGVLGGVLLPVPVTLIADLAPAKSRSTLIGLAYAGIGVGQLATAGISAWLLEPYGWRVGFWVGGLVPLLLVPLIMRFVPESPRYLSRMQTQPARIHQALHLLGIRLVETTKFVAAAPSEVRKLALLALFQQGRAPLTIALWVPSLLSIFAGTLVGLTPTFFHDLAGVSLVVFSGSMSLLLFGTLLAFFLTGAVMDRVGPHRVIIVSALAGGLATSALAFVPFGTNGFKVLMFFSGLFMVGAIQGLNIVAPTLYPPAMRSSAVGAKAGISKLASAIAPLVGGVILAAHASLTIAMFAIAAPLLLVCFCVPLLMASATRSGLFESKGG